MNLGGAILPFAGDDIAVLLLEYKLTHAGEVEVEVDQAAVTSNNWSSIRAFFVDWREAGSLTYASRSNSIPYGETKEGERDLLNTFLAPNSIATSSAPVPLALNGGTNIILTPKFAVWTAAGSPNSLAVGSGKKTALLTRNAGSSCFFSHQQTMQDSSAHRQASSSFPQIQGWVC
jgi:hypothetical protein